jgi:hypothetical protein
MTAKSNSRTKKPSKRLAVRYLEAEAQRLREQVFFRGGI